MEIIVDEDGKWEVEVGETCINRRLLEPSQKYIDEHPVPDPIIAVKKSLEETDAGMARVAEDIFDLLVSEGKVFPQSVIDKIAERKALRSVL